MILSSVCARATSAFFFPIRFTSDQYLAENRVFLVRAAAQAHSHRIAFSMLLPERTLVRFFLPALSKLPGHTPAQAAMACSFVNCSISVPISAITMDADCSLTPGNYGVMEGIGNSMVPMRDRMRETALSSRILA